MDAKLKSRLVVGFVGMLVLVGIIANTHWLLLGVCVLFALVMVKEFFGLMQNLGARPLPMLGYGAVVAYFAVAAVKAFNPAMGARMGDGFGMVTAFLLVGAMLWQMALVNKGDKDTSVRDLGATVLGSVYVGGLFSLLFQYKALLPVAFPNAFGGDDSRGHWLMLLPFCGSWGSDSGAYFAGRFFGATQMAPRLSPKKTWEGTLGGLLSGAVSCLVLGLFVKDVWPIYQFFLFGLVMGLMGTVGDLGMSAIKRESGAKDTGTLLKGHGGVLDRSDSLLLATPAAYLYLLVWVNWHGLLK